jgi:co-chaperonin GroES (HSP10)
MKAINHYVIVEYIKEEPKKTKGLLLMEKHQDDVRYRKGKIISAGNLVEGLKEDDLIYYDKHAGYGIEFEEKLYWVIKSQDVVVVL